MQQSSFRNRNRSLQNGLVLQQLVPYFLEMKNLLMIINQRVVFTSKERIIEVTKVNFPIVEARKAKIKGNCFICMKPNNLLKDCKANKPCFHCQKVGNHHRNLCPKSFSSNDESETLAMYTDPLMTSANLNTSKKHSTRLVLDCGSQRTYISEDLVNKLQLLSNSTEILTVITFGSTKSKEFKTPVVEFGLKLKNGQTMNIQAIVVPKITGII